MNKLSKYFNRLLTKLLSRFALLFVVVFLFVNNNYAQNVPDSTQIPIAKDTLLVSDSTQSAFLSKPVKNTKSGLDAPFDYLSSDSTEILLNEQKIRLYRNAEVKYGSIELKAENIILDMNTKIIVAYGNTDTTGEIIGKPLFKEGSEEFEADTIVYNFESKKGLIKGVFTRQGDGFLHSDLNKKLPNNEICLKNGKYTTCDHEHPHFYLALTKAKVIPDDKIVSSLAYLVIEDVPMPIGIPFGFFPNNSGGSSGVLIPSYGDDLSRGFFLRDGGYYFNINEYVNTKVLGDIYSKGSWGVSNETNYNWKYHFNGKFYGKYSKFISNGDEPSKSEEITYNFKWNHSQDPKANPYSNFSADVNFGSSKFKRYNSTNINDRLSSSQNSSISYTRKLGNSPFNLSINARQSQNTSVSAGEELGKMNISLPEANLSMGRIYPFKGLKKVGSDTWYEKIGISYTANTKNTVVGLNEDTLWSSFALSQFKSGMQHRVPISTNLKILKYINLTPSVNLTERWYLKSLHRTYNMDSARIEIDTLNGFARAGDFSVSLPLTTKMYGMYQLKGKDPVVKAFRHVMTPTVSFSWRPDFSEQQWGYYEDVYAGDSLVGTYSRFDGANGSWSGLYGSPPKGKSGNVNFTLSNNLEMKVRNRKDTVEGTKVIKLIDRLSIRTGYNLALDSMNWSNVSISAGTQIAKILNIDMSMSLDPYDYNHETGGRVNKLLWEEGNIGKLKTANLSSSISLTSNGFKNKRPSPNLSEGERENLRNNGISDQMLAMGYADFSMPWRLNVRYSINYSEMFDKTDKKFVENVTQTMNFSGSVTVTDSWKGTFRSGYDFQKEELSYTSVGLTRELHCWQMSFNWVPFGTYQSYYFKINVKSAMLQDLKYEQRRTWLEDL